AARCAAAAAARRATAAAAILIASSSRRVVASRAFAAVARRTDERGRGRARRAFRARVANCVHSEFRFGRAGRYGSGPRSLRARR
ncbi:hypothetical protein, partial [Burkholderia multivorans]|uniref:hypothetical protein n=1 Tax=Burkholderia multivorans TaxID=87883 RepID=UPI001BA267DF